VNYDSYENEKIKELYQAIHDEKISLPQKYAFKLKKKKFKFSKIIQLVGE